jgi:hypothetical protein
MVDAALLDWAKMLGSCVIVLVLMMVGGHFMTCNVKARTEVDRKWSLVQGEMAECVVSQLADAGQTNPGSRQAAARHAASTRAAKRRHG